MSDYNVNQSNSSWRYSSSGEGYSAGWDSAASNNGITNTSVWNVQEDGSFTSATNENGSQNTAQQMAANGSSGYDEQLARDWSDANKEQPNAEDSEDLPGSGNFWPVNLSDTLFGLPPIYNDDPVVSTLIKNSFPILRIRPIKVIRPDTAQGVTQTEYLGETYKFVCQNDGSVSYQVNNEYEASMLEDFFKSTFQIDALSQFFQTMNTSRLGNKAMAGGVEMLNSTSVGKMFKAIFKVGEDFADYSMKGLTDAINSDKIDGGAKKMLQTMKSMGSTLVSAAFKGQKIDIPNIWTGSSGKISQKVTIKLHCLCPGDDRAFINDIALPLAILHRLADPYSKTEANNDSDDSDNENDIITYENPCYVEAELDGLFTTRIGAITSFAVDVDFKNISFAQNRPYLVTVNLDIIDLYDVIVWHDKVNKGNGDGGTVYAPNGKQMIFDLLKREKDSAQPDLHPDLSYQFMPQGNPNGGFDGWLNGIANKILSPVNTVLGAIGNAVSSTLGVAANFIDQTISLGMNTLEYGVDAVFGENSYIGQGAQSIANTINGISNTIDSSGNKYVNNMFSSSQIQSIGKNTPISKG